MDRGGSRRRTAVARAALAAVAVFAAGGLALAARDDPDPPVDAAPTTTSSPPEGGAPAPGATTSTVVSTTTTLVDESRILLAWTSGGLPPGFSALAAGRPEVERIAVVRGGQADLLSSRAADGTQVDAAPPGWALPLDVVAVDPAAYAGFTDDVADRALVAALQPGQALLTASSAELRGIDVGGTLELRGGAVVVVGIVADSSGAESELVIHVDDAERFGVATERFVLMVHDPAGRAALDAALVDHAAPAPVHLRTPADTTRLRHGDSVVPAVQVKRAFGEFAYRDREGRAVEIDPAWVEANIVTAPVPILGQVRCHRAMIEPLATALGQLEAEGLAHVVDRATFAGCWNARRMVPGSPLSKHSWGIALDINVDGDPRGSYDTQHPRLVELMRAAGFAWGGDWLVADPAHYELDP